MSLSIDQINKLEKENKLLKLVLKEIKRILLVNKMPSLPLAGVNTILDLINKAEELNDNN